MVFSGTPVSTTNKTDCHDIAEILLKVMLNTITPFFYLQTSDRHHNHVQTEETDTVSDGGEADDEFECDCQFCVGSRLNQGRNEVDGNEGIDQTGNDSVNIDGATADTSDDDRLNMW